MGCICLFRILFIGMSSTVPCLGKVLTAGVQSWSLPISRGLLLF